MIGEKYVQRAALGERLEVGDDARERNVVSVVTVDPVQARGAAGDIVGLLLDEESKPGLRGSRSGAIALVLGANG